MIRPSQADGTPGEVPDQPGRAAQLRGVVASLFHLEPGRPAWVVGARMAVIIAVPLAVGTAIGQVPDATFVCLGALNGGMADTGGAQSTRWHALGAASVGNAVAIAAGTVAGLHLGTAIPLLFVVAFVSGCANLYGNVAANVGFTSLILFIVGIGLPADGSVAVQRLWLTLLGGLWTVVIALVVWPVHPYAAARAAVVEGCRSTATVVGLAADRTAGRTSVAVELAAAADVARAQLTAARAILTATREGRRGTSRTGAMLLRILGATGATLVQTEGLVTVVELALATPGTEPMTATAAEVLGQVADALGRLATSVERHDAQGDHRLLAEIDQRLAAADEELAGLRQIGGDDALARVRPVAEGIHRLVLNLRAIDSARRGDDGIPGQAVETTDSVGPRWETRLSGAWQTAVSNATLKSAAVRHGLRYGATSVVGLVLMSSLDLVKGYWVLITIAVVLRPYSATTLHRAVLRVGGTVVGAVLAAVAVVGVVEQPAVLVAVMAVLSVLTFALLPINYGLGVVFLTPLVIVLISASAPGHWGLAGDRILDTLIGAALALVGGYLLWPGAERHDVVDELAEAVESDRRQLSAVLDRDRLVGSPGPDNHARHQSAGLAVANALAAFQRVLGEPVGRQAPTAALWLLTETVRRVYLATTALEEYPPVVASGLPVELMTAAGSAADAALAEVAAALRQRRLPDRSAVGLAQLTTIANQLSEAAMDLRRHVHVDRKERSVLTPAVVASRQAWLMAGIIQQLVVLIGELDHGTEALIPALVAVSAGGHLS
jgi:uncharacterized membrane protein YccC